MKFKTMINKDMKKFEKYAEDNHQPVNKNKTVCYLSQFGSSSKN